MALRRRVWVLAVACWAALDFTSGYSAAASASDRTPTIHPDYAGITLPANIAPMNFLIQEPGAVFQVELSGSRGKPIRISGTQPRISIDPAEWRNLLSANRGSELLVSVRVQRSSGEWRSFVPITNCVAAEEIDPVLVYRKIHAAHSTWSAMGLYQRELSSFKETPFLENRRFANDCSHCHALHGGNPAKMTIIIRSSHFGNSLLVISNKTVQAISGSTGFIAWHPKTNLIASSFSQPRLILHTARNDMRDIAELQAWMGYFKLGEEKVRAIPGLSDNARLRSFPVWSPDGAYLYYCSAPNPWTNMSTLTATSYRLAKYDLMRIPFDYSREAWGEPELVLAASDLGLSVAQPRISPDGRWIFFCAPEYGCWPTYDVSSDLYGIDLQKPAPNRRFAARKLELNSPQCESWLSWSSNSRWVVFSSKRISPLYNRPHIAYVRPDGTCAKPFVLPQADPEYYDSLLKTYTIPTLATGPITVPERELVAAIRGPKLRALQMPEARAGDASR